MVRLLSVKAQAFSFDFLMACSIFILVLVILYGYWTYTYKEIEETRNINTIIDKANLASQAWFRDGTPIYWDSNNVIDLGLQNDHRFNETKMDILNVSIGYNRTKTLIGLDGYDYFFRIYNSTNDTVYNFGQYLVDADNVVKVNRIGILNGSIVSLEVVVWE